MKTNRVVTDIRRGRAALAAYVKAERLNRIEAAQDYTITDAIVALLKLARAKGFDAASILRSAEGHFEVETAGDGSHSKDSDCTVDAVSGCCIGCEIEHGPRCPVCKQRAYHLDGCERGAGASYPAGAHNVGGVA